MRYFRRADGRTYTIFPVSPDLFGDLVIITVHGSSRSRLGGTKTYLASDLAAAESLEARIAKTRLQHGYQEVTA